MIGLVCSLSLVHALGAGADAAIVEARDAIGRGDFAQATRAYQRAVDEAGASADLLYNLGTAALKAGDVGSASLALERAQRLAPSDDDIAFNLARARERVGGPLSSAAGLARPGASLLRFSTSRWQQLAFAVLALALLGAIGHALVPSRWLLARRGLVGVCLVCVVAGLALGWLALARARIDERGDGVLVASTSQAAREAPASDAPAAFAIEPGMPLQRLEEREAFARVRLLNGLEGWVDARAIALVVAQDR